MVQAGGCGGVTEIAERSRGRGGAALTGVPCGVHKWASIARPGGGAYCWSPGGGCSNARGAKVRTRSSQSRLELVRVQVVTMSGSRGGETLPISSCTDDGR